MSDLEKIGSGNVGQAHISIIHDKDKKIFIVTRTSKNTIYEEIHTDRQKAHETYNLYMHSRKYIDNIIKERLKNG